jgi:purine-nucleoside phosphorylase
MGQLGREVQDSVADIRERTDISSDIGIILGTGLGSIAERIEELASVPYEEIAHFPVSTVEFHAGRLIFGMLSGRKVIAMQGRFHVYEGYTMQQVAYPVRVLKSLGVKTLLVSNASGGLNPELELSDIVLITDHINLLGGNPLIGPNHDDFGDRFPDMFNCYDRELGKLAERCALEHRIRLRRGVYVAVTGPNLETAAEYRFLRIIGGDVVGMSTVPEVIAARHQGTRVLGFSIVTDMGLPDAMQPVNIDRIIENAKKAEPDLTRLIEAVIAKFE